MLKGLCHPTRKISSEKKPNNYLLLLLLLLLLLRTESLKKFSGGGARIMGKLQKRKGTREDPLQAGGEQLERRCELAVRSHVFSRLALCPNRN